MTADLAKASTYTDWWRSAITLDNLPIRYDWRANPLDDVYDYRHLDERLQELKRLRRNDKPVEAVNTLRHGLLRNLFNITQLSLYKNTYISTKGSIHAYIEESLETIKFIAESPVSLTSGGGRLTAQSKLEALQESRVTFGSTALLLQGGSIFGICHLGVVKALLEHGILPKVIVGTHTGALMAALVGIHTDEELPGFLCGDSIDLSAFAASSLKAREKTDETIDLLDRPPPQTKFHNLYNTFERRTIRLVKQGFLLDPSVLAESVQANVGDLTFEEAYQRTGRILNIIISSPSEEIPNLMNYLTAPHVLIRSAAMASHITNMARNRASHIQLLHKGANGEIRAVEVPSPTKAKVRRPPSAADRRTPLTRLKQLFNVDHFIISQARPYVAPFVEPSLPYVRKRRIGFDRWWRTTLSKIKPGTITEWIKHGMLIADILGVLPDGLRRILSDETVKGDSLTLVPELGLTDWRRLLKNPTKEEIDFWIMRGERSVWPSLCALKVRLMIEMALDQAYERVRKRRPSTDPLPSMMVAPRMQVALTPPPDVELPLLMLNSGEELYTTNADDAVVDSSGGEEVGRN